MLKGVSAEDGEQGKRERECWGYDCPFHQGVDHSEEADPEGSEAVSYLRKNILEEEQQVPRL